MTALILTKTLSALIALAMIWGLYKAYCHLRGQEPSFSPLGDKAVKCFLTAIVLTAVTHIRLVIDATIIIHPLLKGASVFLALSLYFFNRLLYSMHKN